MKTAGFEGSHYQILDTLPQLLYLLTVIKWGFQAFMELTLQPLVVKEVQGMLLISSGAVGDRKEYSRPGRHCCVFLADIWRGEGVGQGTLPSLQWAMNLFHSECGKKGFLWPIASLWIMNCMLEFGLQSWNQLCSPKVEVADRYWLGIENSITDSDVISLGGATESFCLERAKICFVWWLMATILLRKSWTRC